MQRLSIDKSPTHASGGKEKKHEPSVEKKERGTVGTSLGKSGTRPQDVNEP